MRRLRRFLTSARYTRPSQLARRLQLLAARFTYSRIGRFKRDALRRKAAALAAEVTPGTAPRPLPPRSGMLRRDGERLVLRFLNQEIEFRKSIDWQIARTGSASHLWGFHLHYHEFLEEAGSEEFQAIVLDWIALNPPYAKRYWFDAWSSYALSLRAVVWMQQLDRRRGELPDAFLAAACRSLCEQVLFLEANLELDLGGNHLLKNVKALLYAARFLGTTAAPRWRLRAETVLARELAEQILPDGLHFERSPAYHGQAFADLLECKHAAGPGPLATRLDAHLAAMAQALADLTHPDGLPSLFNDGGLHMGYEPGALLAAWAQDRGETPAGRSAVRLAVAGYFGLRSGSDLLLMDAGPVAPDALPAHGHGDILGFEWTVAGRRLVVDTGVFEYASGERRRRSRSTEAHNTVTVDGADQCEFYGEFRVARRARVTVERAEVGGGRIEVTASHDGFTRLPGGGIHRRTLSGTLDAFTLDDSISGSRGTADAWIILHPDARVTIDGSRARISCRGVVAELVASAPLSAGPWEWWPDFGVSIPTTRLRVRYGALPARGRIALTVVVRP